MQILKIPTTVAFEKDEIIMISFCESISVNNRRILVYCCLTFKLFYPLTGRNDASNNYVILNSDMICIADAS